MIEQVHTLDEVIAPEAGRTVYCEADDTVYRWDPIAGWEEMTVEGGLTMSAYDINKQLVGQLEILDKTALITKKEMVRQYMKTSGATYFMLLCRDINYYTIFHRTPIDYDMSEDILEDVLIDECLPALGAIKAIDLTENGDAIEIWWEDVNGNVYVAYFFDYDDGVVVCV